MNTWSRFCINLLVYTYPRILELLSSFTKFKKKAQTKKKPTQKTQTNASSFLSIIMAIGVAFLPRNAVQINFWRSTWMKYVCYTFLVKFGLVMGYTLQVLSHYTWVLCLNREGERYTSAEIIPLWNHQTKPKPNQPQPSPSPQKPNPSCLCSSVYIHDIYTRATCSFAISVIYSCSVKISGLNVVLARYHAVG